MKPTPLLAALCAAVIATLAAPSVSAQKTVVTVASFPDLDRAAKAAVPRWNKRHPDIEIKLVSLQYADHHTAMSTALATGSGLPDVMAVDFRFIGKFVEAGGLEDLLKAPYNAGLLREKFVRFTVPQASNSKSELAALPTDIGPGTLLYRKDIVEKAGVTEAELTQGWESYIEAGRKIKAKTGAYLLADAADIRDIVIGSGLKEGEGLYFDREGRVLVDSPRFVRAFERGRTARQAGIDAKVVAWTNEWSTGFRQNRIATQMMGAWLAGHLKKLARSRHRGAVACRRLARWRCRELRRFVLRHTEEGAEQGRGLAVHRVHDARQGNAARLAACARHVSGARRSPRRADDGRADRFSR